MRSLVLFTQNKLFNTSYSFILTSRIVYSRHIQNDGYIQNNGYIQHRKHDFSSMPTSPQQSHTSNHSDKHKDCDRHQRESNGGDKLNQLIQSRNTEVIDRGTEKWKRSVVIAKHPLITRRRIPPNFLEDVFIPHLEHWIWNSKFCPPWYLLEVLIAYSQMPKINKSLTDVLTDMILNRITDYNGPEFVKMLLPFYKMRPDDLELFAHISIELEEHFYELTTLHLVGVARIYAKIHKNEQQIEFIENQVVPRLQTDIAKYDTSELSALLVSLAAAHKMSTLADVPLLAAIIPQIEKRYDETPLLTTIINLNALCRLHIYHKRLLDLASSDLSDRWRIRNIPPKYIATAVWTFAQFSLLNRILPAFEELIDNNLHKFTAREFARFSQVLPETSRVPLHLTIRLMETLPEMSRDHFMFFFIGIIRCGFLPIQPGSSPNPTGDGMTDDWDGNESQEGRKKKFYELFTDGLKKAEIKLREAVIKQSMGQESKDETKDNGMETKDGRVETKEDGVDMGEKTEKVAVPRETILHESLEYCNTFEDDFEVDEIHRLGHILRCHPQYSYISTLFPKSWELIINEVMIMAK